MQKLQTELAQKSAELDKTLQRVSELEYGSFTFNTFLFQKNH